MVLEAGFIRGKLVDESGSNLQIRSSAVQKLQRLQQRPLILAHNIRGKGTGSTTLPPDRVHKHTLSGLQCFLDKFKDGIAGLIFRIEQQLKRRVNSR